MKLVVALLVGATFYAGIHFGSTVAGGADSYGYVSEAGLWLQGQLSIQHDIVRASPWPLAIETWAPLGYRPSASSRDAIVPIYPPGLPLLMAAFQAIAGFCAAFVVSPLCGAATVWLTHAIGQRVFARPAISLSAAVLVATSPIFLSMLMNPMSDIPVTAAWTASLYLATVGAPLCSGLAGAAALLIRPNLVLVAVAIGSWIAMTNGRPVRFVLGLVPAIVIGPLIAARLYGSVFLSGYGGVADLYALGYFGQNVRQFAAWLVDTQSPFILAAVVYFALPGWAPSANIRRPHVLFGACIAAVVLSYLFYIPFDAWWYLRFLLPAWPVAMIVLAASLDAMIRRAAPRAGAIGLAIATLLLAFNGTAIAARRFAFDIGRGERRYIDVARFVVSHTDPDAVMFTVQHSGTLRMYAGRLTLRFDQLDAAWLDRAVEFLHQSGRHPYFVLEAGERTMFVGRFGASNHLGRLDWRPMATFSEPPLEIYDPISRDGADPLVIAATASRTVGWRCDLPQAWPTPLRLK